MEREDMQGHWLSGLARVIPGMRERKGQGGGLRELHDDRGAYTGCAGELHGAVVTGDNLLTDGQTQPGAALSLGAVKWLTGTRQDLRGYAHARIHKAETHRPVRRLRGGNSEHVTGGH